MLDVLEINSLLNIGWGSPNSSTINLATLHCQIAIDQTIGIDHSPKKMNEVKQI
jgi:hypothetical protein